MSKSTNEIRSYGKKFNETFKKEVYNGGACMGCLGFSQIEFTLDDVIQSAKDDPEAFNRQGRENAVNAAISISKLEDSSEQSAKDNPEAFNRQGQENAVNAAISISKLEDSSD